MSDDNISDSECSDTASEARDKAKAAAKQQQQKSRRNTENKRPVELLSDTLRDGFGAFERILTARQPKAIENAMPMLIERLVTSIESSDAKHEATSQAICNSIAGLQATTATLFQEILKQLQQPSAEKSLLFAVHPAIV